jgi:hypothetical protein
MSTKANPGKYNCYEAAAPDEPMFVLLGRDPMAGALVRLWALMREEAGESADKVAEAISCAEQLDAWVRSLGKKPVHELLDITPLDLAQQLQPPSV